MCRTRRRCVIRVRTPHTSLAMVDPGWWSIVYTTSRGRSYASSILPDAIGLFVPGTWSDSSTIPIKDARLCRG